MRFLGLADVVRIRWIGFQSSREPIFYTRGHAQSWLLCAWLGILSLGIWEGTLLRAASLPVGFAETLVPGNWSDAVGIYFEANGRQYIWERTGRVWFQDNAETNYTLLLDISDEVGTWQDHGMLGFALDPNFRANGYFYLLYVVDRYHLFNFGSPGYNSASNQYDEATIGRLTRYTCNAADGFRSVLPASRFVLIGETRQTGIPIVSYSHGVGSLVFGEDGTLLVSTGDGSVANGADPGGGGYAAQALADEIIRSKEDVGAFRAQLVDCLNGKV
ncbi:MAG TPA: PQQ-dependent sugar dehydrogenase, partial [Candidatus Dormibacteraeota bacterium]|nr:PQQ-dependent sugar dehydrogenase [Candidatus Dormibacteraeota bacterium]